MTNFDDESQITISFEDYDTDNPEWRASQDFSLDFTFNSQFASSVGIHSGSGSDASVNEIPIAFPVPQEPRNAEILDLEVLLSSNLENSRGPSAPSSSSFHDSSGYNSTEETTTFSLPMYPHHNVEQGYSSAEESSHSAGRSSYSYLSSAFNSQGHKPTLSIECDRGYVSAPAIAPRTPPLSSGYTSDSGSFQSPDFLSPQNIYGPRQSLAVMEPSRGRRQFRRPLGSRHVPYGHHGRSSSLAGIEPSELEAMMNPQPNRSRPRSSSVISSSSSFNGDVSDSDNGYFSSHELSDGYSQYSRSRDQSPCYDSCSEGIRPTNRQRQRHDTTDVTVGGYRENIGSPAIAKASSERRKKLAKFRCTQVNCESTFTTKQNLKNHLNSHLGIRGFRCDNCDKAFTTLHVRERHQVTCRTKGKPALRDLKESEIIGLTLA